MGVGWWHNRRGRIMSTVIDNYRTRKPTVALDEAAPVAAQDGKPDDHLQFEFEMKMLQRSMQPLTQEQQGVITLRFIAEYDTPRIARRLGKSAGAVRGPSDARIAGTGQRHRK